MVVSCESRQKRKFGGVATSSPIPHRIRNVCHYSHTLSLIGAPPPITCPVASAKVHNLAKMAKIIGVKFNGYPHIVELFAQIEQKKGRREPPLPSIIVQFDIIHNAFEELNIE